MTRNDSAVLVTRLDQVMTLTRLEKFLDDSDSKGLWLWLDKNDSDTSLLVSPYFSFVFGHSLNATPSYVNVSTCDSVTPLATDLELNGFLQERTTLFFIHADAVSS